MSRGGGFLFAWLPSGGGGASRRKQFFRTNWGRTSARRRDGQMGLKEGLPTGVGLPGDLVVTEKSDLQEKWVYLDKWIYEKKWVYLGK